MALESRSVARSMEERLRAMLERPQRRQRGQLPMDQVEKALQYERQYTAPVTAFEIDAVSDCTESLTTLRQQKRVAREQRAMLWEDHIATELRSHEARAAMLQAKKLAQETAMLAQLPSQRDKWDMAVDLRLCEFLTDALSVVDNVTRSDFVSSRNGSGATPLHRAVHTNDARLVRLLLDFGADISVRDSAGKSCIHWAAGLGFLELIQLLTRCLSTGTENLLYATDTAGFSLLHTAAMHGHADVLQFLIDLIPADRLSTLVNLPTKRDRLTAIHMAAQHGHPRCLRVLFQCPGVLPDQRSARGSNALHLAMKQTYCIDQLIHTFIECMPREEDVVFQSLDDETGLNGLHKAIIKSFRAVCLALIASKRVALNMATREGEWMPLHLAVMIEDVEIANALVEAGALVDMVDKDGQSALLQSCLGGQLEMVRALLSAGANPAHQNKQAHCPLHYLAAFCRDPALITDVIARGADVNAKSLKLNTPLHFAAMNGNEIAAEVLLAHGASTNALNEDKRSVVYLAKKWRHRGVEDLVKPPEEILAGGGAQQGRSDVASRGRGHQFADRHGAQGTLATGGASRSRSRTPLTTRSEDSEAESLYSMDDEEIYEPSTPWPVALLDNGDGNTGNQAKSARRRHCRSFSELGERFAERDSTDTDDTMDAPIDLRGKTQQHSGSAGKRPELKPIVLSHQKPQHDDELQAARKLLDPVGPPIPRRQLARFTHQLIADPVHIPWDMTVPLVPVTCSGASLSASASDSDLQRKLKPSIRADIGLLRDHLTNEQTLSWPRYANQRVYRKDDSLP